MAARRRATCDPSPPPPKTLLKNSLVEELYTSPGPAGKRAALNTSERRPAGGQVLGAALEGMLWKPNPAAARSSEPH
jgi:hypothetical protein